MIHQFVPMLHRHDAVGRHVVGIQQEFLRRGIPSKIFVEKIDPDTHDMTTLVSRYEAVRKPDELLVYHFATASQLATVLLKRSERLVIVYHNITPPECFAPWDNPLALHQLRGQQQLGLLAHRSVLGVAVSQFNRDDLIHSGFTTTAVLPPLPEPFDGSAYLRTESENRHNWLTVGRIAPNKALEVAIVALSLMRESHDPTATLSIVGRVALDVYADALRRLVGELGLEGAVRFFGQVDAHTLNDLYAKASAVVVTSVHEGFCLQVVEAMERSVPVIAANAAALPEVVGDAGVLVAPRDPSAVVDAALRLRSDKGFCASLVEKGRGRIAALGMNSAASDLCDLLVSVERKETPPPSARVERHKG